MQQTQYLFYFVYTGLTALNRLTTLVSSEFLEDFANEATQITRKYPEIIKNEFLVTSLTTIVKDSIDKKWIEWFQKLRNINTREPLEGLLNNEIERFSSRHIVDVNCGDNLATKNIDDAFVIQIANCSTSEKALKYLTSSDFYLTFNKHSNLFIIILISSKMVKKFKNSSLIQLTEKLANKESLLIVFKQEVDIDPLVYYMCTEDLKMKFLINDDSVSVLHSFIKYLNFEYFVKILESNLCCDNRKQVFNIKLRNELAAFETSIKKFHKFIEKGYSEECKEFVRANITTKCADFNGRSAICWALDSSKYNIYANLKSNEFIATGVENIDEEIENKSEEDRQEIADAIMVTRDENEEAHLYRLLQLSPIIVNASRKAECYDRIKRAYTDLNKNIDIRTNMKIVAKLDVEIHFFFKSDCIHEDPNEKEDCHGKTY